MCLFLFLIPYNKHKFDFHTQKCVFLWYSLYHKGFKCLSKFGKVFIYVSVKFNETNFPFKTDKGFTELLFPNSSKNSSMSTLNFFLPNDLRSPVNSYGSPVISDSITAGTHNYQQPFSITKQPSIDTTYSSTHKPTSKHVPILLESNFPVIPKPDVKAIPSYTFVHTGPTSSQPIISLHTHDTFQSEVVAPINPTYITATSKHISMHPMLTRAKIGHLPPFRTFHLYMKLFQKSLCLYMKPLIILVGLKP